MKNGFDYKSDRHRISSADSSTPTVVEGQDIAEGKDIGKIFYSYKQGFESPKICLVLVLFFSASSQNVLVLVPYFSALALSTKITKI